MTDRPPRWAVFGTLLAATFFIGFVIVYVPFVLTGWRVARALPGGAAVRGLGAALVALSLPVLGDFLVRFVREGHGTPVPLAPPQRLVTGGVFAWVRNPGYLAAEAALVGQGLLFGNPPLLGYATGMALAFHLFVVAFEEPALRRTFGAAYADYCRRVPRWLPRRPRPSR